MPRIPKWWDDYKDYSERVLSSIIWNTEDRATVVVWITMLGLQRDRFVIGNHVSIAKRAGVTEEEARTAIERLECDDPARSMDGHDGRMIERGDGGWRILQKEDWI